MSLSHLADLENRYDGPIPEHERRALDCGGSVMAAVIEASGNHAFYDRMAQRQKRIIEMRKEDGSWDAHFDRDLELYERQAKHWAEIEAKLRAQIGLPRPVMTP